MPVRVTVADDDLLVREGVVQVLSGAPGIEVVAACGDLPSLAEAVERLGPDVVLTDIRMPPSRTDEGVRFAADARESYPALGLIVLSQYAEPSYALRLLEGGAERRGYLLKERVHDRAQLVSAIESVAAGGSVIDSAIVDELVHARSREERSPLGQLTPREREILAEIAQGKSNEAIAESLVLTKRAVEKHINSIFHKLSLSDATDVSKRVMATLLFLGETDAPASRAAGGLSAAATPPSVETRARTTSSRRARALAAGASIRFTGLTNRCRAQARAETRAGIGERWRSRGSRGAEARGRAPAVPSSSTGACGRRARSSPVTG